MKSYELSSHITCLSWATKQWNSYLQNILLFTTDNVFQWRLMSTRQGTPSDGWCQQDRGQGTPMAISTFSPFSLWKKRVFLLEWPSNPYPFLHAVSHAANDWRVPNYVARDPGNWGIARDLMKGARYKLFWIKCPRKAYCNHSIHMKDKEHNSSMIPGVIDLTPNQTFEQYFFC